MPKRETASDEAQATAEDQGLDPQTVEVAAEQQDARLTAVQEAEPVATDQVALVSLNADLTPNQTEGFGIVGDRELAREDLAGRLREQRISNADFSARRALAQVDTGTVGESPGQDPVIAALQEKHEQAAGDFEGDARSIIPE